MILDQFELSLVCSSLTSRVLIHSRVRKVCRLPVPLEDVFDNLSKTCELKQVRVRYCVNSCDVLLDLWASLIQLPY